MKKTTRLLAFVAVWLWAASAHAINVPGPLVETSWLAKHAKQVVILDVRKDLKSFTGKPVLAKDKKSGKLVVKSVGAHIPGAMLVNYKKIRVNRQRDGMKLESIIPLKADFEAQVQAWGVNKDSAIVIVSKGLDNGDMTMATRLYWQLKYFGHDNMAILNGGMAQWLTEKRAISNAAASAGKGNWVATAERNELLATNKEVAAALKKGTQLVDNRPLSQYLGVYKKSYVYAEGHLPGAKSYPNELFVANKAPAKFLATDKLRDLSKGMGINNNAETITYCNSGHLASGGWFIMHELMGNKNVRLFDGSMHEWTKQKGADVTAMKME